MTSGKVSTHPCISLRSKSDVIENIWDRITFNKRWSHAASLVVRKGATVESSFPPLPAYGDYGPGLRDPDPSK